MPCQGDLHHPWHSECVYRHDYVNCIQHIHLNHMHQMCSATNAGCHCASQDCRYCDYCDVSASQHWRDLKTDNISIYTSYTTCPVTEAVTIGHSVGQHVTQTVSTVYQTVTSTICTKCVAPTPAPVQPMTLHEVVTTVMFVDTQRALHLCCSNVFPACTLPPRSARTPRRLPLGKLRAFTWVKLLPPFLRLSSLRSAPNATVPLLLQIPMFLADRHQSATLKLVLDQFQVLLDRQLHTLS